MNDHELKVLRRERDRYTDYLIEWIRMTPDHFAQADAPQPGSVEFQDALQELREETSTHLRTVLRTYRLYVSSEDWDDSGTRIGEVVTTEELTEIKTMVERDFSAIEEEYERLLTSAQ